MIRSWLNLQIQKADCKLCMDFWPPRVSVRNPLLYKGQLSLFIHSEGGHLCCVQAFTVISRAALKFLVLVCGCTHRVEHWLTQLSTHMKVWMRFRLGFLSGYPGRGRASYQKGRRGQDRLLAKTPSFRGPAGLLRSRFCIWRGPVCSGLGFSWLERWSH